MASKLKRISLRISGELKEAFDNKIKKTNIDQSIILRRLIKDYVEDGRDLDIEMEMRYKEFKRKQELKQEAKRQKERLRCYYLIRNTQKTIYQIACSLKINTGDVNMEIINDILDGSERIFKTFPEDIKYMMAVDMEHLRDMRKKEVLNNRINIIMETQKKIEQKRVN